MPCPSLPLPLPLSFYFAALLFCYIVFLTSHALNPTLSLSRTSSHPLIHSYAHTSSRPPFHSHTLTHFSDNVTLPRSLPLVTHRSHPHTHPHSHTLSFLLFFWHTFFPLLHSCCIKRRGQQTTTNVRRYYAISKPPTGHPPILPHTHTHSLSFPLLLLAHLLSSFTV